MNDDVLAMIVLLLLVALAMGGVSIINTLSGFANECFHLILRAICERLLGRRYD